MLDNLAARMTVAKWNLQNKMDREDGLETAEKLVITGIVVVLAVGVFVFIGNIVGGEATDLGTEIQNADTGLTLP